MDVSRRGWLGLAGMAAASTQASATTIRPMLPDPTGFAPAPGIAHLKYNENPLGPPASAIQAMADLARSSWYYADDAEGRLAAMIGKRMGVPASQVVLGHGSSEVITSAALAWGKRGTILKIYRREQVRQRMVLCDRTPLFPGAVRAGGY